MCCEVFLVIIELFENMVKYSFVKYIFLIKGKFMENIFLFYFGLGCIICGNFVCIYLFFYYV